MSLAHRHPSASHLVMRGASLTASQERVSGVAAGEAAVMLRSGLHEALTEQLGTPAPPVHVHVVDVHPN